MKACVVLVYYSLVSYPLWGNERPLFLLSNAVDVDVFLTPTQLCRRRWRLSHRPVLPVVATAASLTPPASTTRWLRHSLVVAALHTAGRALGAQHTIGPRWWWLLRSDSVVGTRRVCPDSQEVLEGVHGFVPSCCSRAAHEERTRVSVTVGREGGTGAWGGIGWGTAYTHDNVPCRSHYFFLFSRTPSMPGQRGMPGFHWSRLLERGEGVTREFSPRTRLDKKTKAGTDTTYRFWLPLLKMIAGKTRLGGGTISHGNAGQHRCAGESTYGSFHFGPPISNYEWRTRYWCLALQQGQR